MTSPHQPDGGPAFPNPALADPDYRPVSGDAGMSLRDYFAGQALAGIMSNCDNTGLNGWSDIQDLAAKYAYAVADAMLAAREGGAS